MEPAVHIGQHLDVLGHVQLAQLLQARQGGGHPGVTAGRPLLGSVDPALGY